MNLTVGRRGSPPFIDAAAKVAAPASQLLRAAPCQRRSVGARRRSPHRARVFLSPAVHPAALLALQHLKYVRWAADARARELCFKAMMGRCRRAAGTVPAEARMSAAATTLEAARWCRAIRQPRRLSWGRSQALARWVFWPSPRFVLRPRLHSHIHRPAASQHGAVCGASLGQRHHRRCPTRCLGNAGRRRLCGGVVAAFLQARALYTHRTQFLGLHIHININL